VRFSRLRTHDTKRLKERFNGININQTEEYEQYRNPGMAVATDCRNQHHHKNRAAAAAGRTGAVVGAFGRRLPTLTETWKNTTNAVRSFYTTCQVLKALNGLGSI